MAPVPEKRPLVLHLVRPAAGGMSQALRAFYAALGGDGPYRYAVAGDLSPELAQALEATPVGTARYPLALGDRVRPLAEPGLVWQLVRLLRGLRPQLLHVQGFRASIPGRMAAALCGIPVVYSLHNWPPDYLPPGQARLSLWLERFLARWTAFYLPVSQALAQRLASVTGPDVRRRLRVVPPALDPTPFLAGGSDGAAGTTAPPQAGPARPAAATEDSGTASGLPALPAGAPLVLTVARLVPSKGLETLVQAVAILKRQMQTEGRAEGGRWTVSGPPPQFWIAGEGPQRPRLEELIYREGLQDQVRLLGQRHDVPQLLARATLFVLPSESEGWGMTAAEAMLAGVPVIATPAGGLPEVLDGCGVLVPPRQPAALAAAIAGLLGDEQRRKELSEKGRNASSARFSPRRVVQETERIYEYVLADRASSSPGRQEKP